MLITPVIAIVLCVLAIPLACVLVRCQYLAHEAEWDCWDRKMERFSKHVKEEARAAEEAGVSLEQWRRSHGKL